MTEGQQTNETNLGKSNKKKKRVEKNKGKRHVINNPCFSLGLLLIAGWMIVVFFSSVLYPLCIVYFPFSIAPLSSDELGHPEGRGWLADLFL